MKFDPSVIKKDEQAIFALRSLYEKYGYRQYRMKKFEEYDLYLQNKDFLISENIITFTDGDGRLMALKPDVTLSIVKGGTDGAAQKVYYNENVYRAEKGESSFKEIMQVGLECIGDIDASSVYEVISLALKSLSALSSDYILDISHMGVIAELADKAGISTSNKDFIKALKEKNGAELNLIDKTGILSSLASAYGDGKTVKNALLDIYGGTLSPSAKELAETVEALEKEGYHGKIRIDFSQQNDLSYYNGIVFCGYIEGVPSPVLSGGQYDSLMRKLKRQAGAIGFAVYLDSVFAPKKEEEEKTVINIALPKGRLGEKVYGMFERAGFPCPSIKENNRKLIFENKELSLRYFWVKPSDVAIYVERGAADIGVCGKDILLEYRPDIYELSDLECGKCRMAVAAKNGFSYDNIRTLRVATKFSNIAKTFYNQKGMDIDIIHLNGSIEIAPILGLSDVIVDIVETGTTLKENDLSVVEEIVPISARLISNRSSFKFKNAQIEEIKEKLTKEARETK